MIRRSDERGAAAVEFALVLIPLLLILLGIIEFGRVYFVQLSLTNAARDAARIVAITQDPDDADRVFDAPGLTAATVDPPVIDCPALDPTSGSVSVTVHETVSVLGMLFGESSPVAFDLTGSAEMPCGG